MHWGEGRRLVRLFLCCAYNYHYYYYYDYYYYCYALNYNNYTINNFLTIIIKNTNNKQPNNTAMQLRDPNRIANAL